LQEHEERISSKRAALDDMRGQVQLLQDRIREAEQRVDALEDEMQEEKALQQTAMSERETSEKWMAKLRAELDL